MKIVTFNVRCLWDKDGINSFVHRCGMIWNKIKEEKPDIIAFQEIVKQSRAFFSDVLEKDYYFIGHLRNEDFSGEGVFTAVRKENFEILGYDSFWLSDTPYVPGSRFKNQSYWPRICALVTAREISTGKIYRIYNTHLDNESEEARVSGMNCIFEKMKECENKFFAETILLGDFNANPKEAVIKNLEEHNAPKLYNLTKDIGITFHDFGKTGASIDYIFVSEGINKEIESVTKWEDCINGIFLSDHYPICAEKRDSE